MVHMARLNCKQKNNSPAIAEVVLFVSLQLLAGELRKLAYIMPSMPQDEADSFPSDPCLSCFLADFSRFPPALQDRNAYKF